MFKLLTMMVAMSLASLSSSGIAADTYPNRPVRIIVGYEASSGVDIMARLFAKPLGVTLGQPFVVENRPGAASSLAAASVARSDKDGYTLFMATSSNAANSIAPNLGFDFIKDFTPVLMTTRLPFILVANPAMGLNNVQDLIALAKTKPGQVFFGSTGMGGTAHLTGELFNMKTGVQLVHVPYQGSARAITDLRAGRIAVMFLPASTVAAHIAAGTLKALATASPARSNIAPNVPTMAEAGLRDFETSLWDGLVAPAGTPSDIINRLANALNQAFKDQELIATLKKYGAEPGGGTPQKFAEFIAAEIQKWIAVADAAGLRK